MGSYREPPATLGKATERLIEAMAGRSVPEIEEAARWLAHHMSKEAKRPAELPAIIDEIGELERELAERRARSRLTVDFLAFVVAIGVLWAAEGLWFVGDGLVVGTASFLCAYLINHLLFSRLPTLTGVEQLLRDVYVSPRVRVEPDQLEELADERTDERSRRAL